MDTKYLIVLFKNKQRYKIINKFKTYNKALCFFEKKLNLSKDVIFDIKTENGKNVDYEIGLLELSNSKNMLFTLDEIGRNVSMSLDDPDYSMIKIDSYKLPEKIYCISTKKRLEIDEFIKKYLPKSSYRLVSKLNNKIIVQDDEEINLFSLKSNSDASRLLDSLERFMINNNRNSCLIVKDSSIEQKKYLYKVLSDKGIDKKMLYRASTTHLKDI